MIQMLNYDYRFVRTSPKGMLNHVNGIFPGKRAWGIHCNIIFTSLGHHGITLKKIITGANIIWEQFSICLWESRTLQTCMSSSGRLSTIEQGTKNKQHKLVEEISCKPVPWLRAIFILSRFKRGSLSYLVQVTHMQEKLHWWGQKCIL